MRFHAHRARIPRSIISKAIRSDERRSMFRAIPIPAGRIFSSKATISDRLPVNGSERIHRIGKSKCGYTQARIVVTSAPLGRRGRARCFQQAQRRKPTARTLRIFQVVEPSGCFCAGVLRQFPCRTTHRATVPARTAPSSKPQPFPQKAQPPVASARHIERRRTPCLSV